MPGAMVDPYFVMWLISPLAGFTYSLRSVHVHGPRVSVEFDPAELWQAWCAEQTPRMLPSGAYACVSAGEAMTERHMASPTKANLCGDRYPSVCDCDLVGDATVAVRLRRQR